MPFTLSARMSVRTGAMRKVMRQEARNAVYATGRYVQELAQRNARPGLRKYIQMSSVQETPTTIYVEVGLTNKIAVWQEGGTGVYVGKPRIRSKSGKVMSWEMRNTRIWGMTGGRIGQLYNLGRVKVVSGIQRSRSGKIQKSRKRDVYRFFAASVRGVPPQKFLERAFRSSQARAYWRTRLAIANRRIRAAGY